VSRVRHVTFRFDGRRVERDRRRPFAATVLRRRDAGSGSHAVTARVKRRGGARRTLKRRVRTCPE
jgi:hypothetical protein